MINKKHLFWIIPLFTLGFWLLLVSGVYIGESMAASQIKDALSWSNVYTPNCWDGCIYSEWIIDGYKNRSRPSQLYQECSAACMFGDNYFTVSENDTSSIANEIRIAKELNGAYQWISDYE